MKFFLFAAISMCFALLGPSEAFAKKNKGGDSCSTVDCGNPANSADACCAGGS